MNEESKAGKLEEGEKRSSAPSISLPKGGGAIRGIGEKFAANPVTGTGSMSVPIATSPGRSGFGPQLSLTYDSGSGNGPFGFGWNLSLPSITRKTDKGLPKYQDGDKSDTFILSGAEDLVPVLKKQGNDWVSEDVPDRTIDTDTYRIKRFRPRIEGLFARIERWTNVQSNETHWLSITRDNITTLYGKDNNSRIFDPSDPNPNHPTRIFSWLICESHDDKGNVVLYKYAEENSLRIFEDQNGQPISLAHEQNRNDQSRSANRYLKRIFYGNRTPYFPNSVEDNPPSDPGEWLFEVVCDYGEHDIEKPTPDGPGPWPCRPDPFSTYRAGFEVRTYRLCQRFLMFHRFPELGDTPCLVRSTDFTFRYEKDPTDADNPVNSFLESVSHFGYKRKGDNSYISKSLPPLEFKYSRPVIQEKVESPDADSMANLPVGLDGNFYQWVDLDGEGLSGILTRQESAWYYKPNLSPVTTKQEDNKEIVVACFGPMEQVALQPSLYNSGNGQLLDLAGDGKLDLASFSGATPGFYERTENKGWDNFIPFTSLPNIPWDDPNLRFVDLNGDGHADILITEDEVLNWYPSLAEEGFGSAQRVYQPLDEEQGPRLIFADGTQSIQLADLSGDGLSDLVRIRNGEVCYWPNLGYGRFGAKVTMDNSPWFDLPDQFDHRRLHLADIDGSGTTDIIYLKYDEVNLYFNQSGNSWSKAVTLNAFPSIDDLSNVTVLDLLGNGTACLVWSSSLPGDSHQSLRYIDLMGRQKPHLLVQSKNNLGAETIVKYASSTKFYLTDKLKGTPWITRIPFPVHVVERVETYDRISRNRFVTRYAYRHGYFDGEEREFRGFGMVEQWDTEEIGKVWPEDADSTNTNLDKESFVPPVNTKTWFHTGAFIDREHISDFFAGLMNGKDKGEYYREPGLTDAQANALLLEDTVLPTGLTVEEEREACRALKGSMLRQEVYALDGAGTEDYPHGHPYTVTEQNLTIRLLQPKNENNHAVYFTHAREVINYHYERNPTDPRISHAMALETDKYGNILKSLAIGYGRRKGESPLEGDDDIKKQEQTLITYTENDITNAIDKPVTDSYYDYRTPLPGEVRTYELTGLEPEDAAQRFSFDELTQDNFEKIRILPSVPYETATDYDLKGKRLIERVRTLYRKNDLTEFLEKDKLESQALPGETYQLAFTQGLLDQVYKHDEQPLIPDYAEVLKVDTVNDRFADRGGYVDLDKDDNWWIPSGRVFFHHDPAISTEDERLHARQNFFLPQRFLDPFGQGTTISYDPYNLLLLESEDSLQNKVTAGERKKDDQENITIENKNDYRVLQPGLITGPNGNRTEVAFDALGLVVGTAVRGKTGEKLGDSLDDFKADLIQGEINSFFNNPKGQAAKDLLKNATTRIIYDVDRYHRLDGNEPTYAAPLARETHYRNPIPDDELKIQVGFSYSDGLGREIQKKAQAEKGPVPVRDNENRIKVDANNQPVLAEDDVEPRWIGSDWTIFNNKGKPVRQYEPFFSDTHKFDDDPRIGVSPTLFYDPVGRVVATLHPNHTYEKVVFDPWRQETWDVNDTIHPSHRYNPQNGDLPDPNFQPIDDPDVGHYFGRLSEDKYRPTWFHRRMDPDERRAFWPDQDENGDPLPQNQQIRLNEKKAAKKAAQHAKTPAVTHFDSLGRVFLTVADNGKDSDGNDQLFETRVNLDIEGNEREVIDARGNAVMSYAYNIAGPEEEGDEEGSATNRIYQDSMDAGKRWMLNDIAGNPIRSWDSRGHTFSNEYDELRRPVKAFVAGAYPQDRNRVILFEQLVYGDGADTGLTDHEIQQANLRGQVYKVFDGAGAVTNEAYDFKGNLLHNKRQLTEDYKTNPDWNNNPLLSNHDIFTSKTEFDALNRPVKLIAPDKSVIRSTFNEANLLEAVEVNLHGEKEDNGPIWSPFVKDIDYDAKGQREYIEYGNGVKTAYKYDPLTYRLVHLFTTRGSAFPDDCSVQNPNPCDNPPKDCPKTRNFPCGVQNLHYTYDPAGNITRIQDIAQQTIYFNNRKVEPTAEYTYDAIYRLIEAEGREHLGQNNSGKCLPPSHHSPTDSPRVSLPHPGDGNAMGRYRERYVYDAVGNILEMIHTGIDPDHSGWKQCCQYAINSNRLLKSGCPNDPAVSCSEYNTYNHDYAYDAHGNMTKMPHLPFMEWDFEDQLHATARQVVSNGGETETTYYVYDAGGQRVRKVTEPPNGKLKNERLYLGGFEIYREYNGNVTSVKLERETLLIMGNEQRIALVETQTIENSNPVNNPSPLQRYQLGNHLGSASVELNEKAQVISYEEHSPYGSTVYQAMDKNMKAAAKRYRYTGKERDEETGFNYHGARYYALWLGRWTAADPVGIRGGTNLYGYISENPVKFIDPHGLQKSEHQEPNVAQNFQPMLKKLTENISLISNCRKLLVNPHIPSIVRSVHKNLEKLSATLPNLGNATRAVGIGLDIPPERRALNMPNITSYRGYVTNRPNHLEIRMEVNSKTKTGQKAKFRIEHRVPMSQGPRQETDYYLSIEGTSKIKMLPGATYGVGSRTKDEHLLDNPDLMDVFVDVLRELEVRLSVEVETPKDLHNLGKELSAGIRVQPFKDKYTLRLEMKKGAYIRVEYSGEIGIKKLLLSQPLPGPATTLSTRGGIGGLSRTALDVHREMRNQR